MQVLASLNRMLQSKETKEQGRMQNALAMMQYAQQKKMQDYQLASSQIGILQQANQVMQAKQAQKLVTDLGLSRYDVSSPEAIIKSKSDLEKSSWRGGAGLEEEQANQLISAYTAYTTNNYTGMLQLASSFKGVMDMPEGAKLNDNQKSIRDMFVSLGYTDDKENAMKSLDAIELSIKNDDLILQEQFELAQGDTKIDEKLSSFSVDELADSAEEMDAAGEILSVNHPKQEMKALEQYITSLHQEVEEKQLSLDNLAEEAKTLEIYKKSEQLSDDQKDYYDRIPELKEMIEKEMGELSEQIDKEKTLTTLLQEETKSPDKWEVEKKVLKGSMEVGKHIPGIGLLYRLADPDDPALDTLLEVAQHTPHYKLSSLPYRYIRSKIDE